MTPRFDRVAVAARAGIWVRPEGLSGIGRFVRGQINPDGGFRGRSPDSDLYYTAFGLDCLAALKLPLPKAAARRFLEAMDQKQEPHGLGKAPSTPGSASAGEGLNFVELASAIRCWTALGGPSAGGRRRELLARLESYRAADGGYRHTEGGGARGTVYGGFLAFLAYGEVGKNLPAPEKLLASLRSLRAPDGGYANADRIAGGTTPATAAALLLQLELAGGVEAETVRALQACERPGGGYVASAETPGPDLLSTATALYALRRAGCPPASPARHAGFVESLWSDDGGFRGHPADPAADCEYTFYALLALGACVGSARALPGI